VITLGCSVLQNVMFWTPPDLLDELHATVRAIVPSTTAAAAPARRSRRSGFAKNATDTS
jgi:hypothetical protein